MYNRRLYKNKKVRKVRFFSNRSLVKLSLIFLGFFGLAQFMRHPWFYNKWFAYTLSLTSKWAINFYKDFKPERLEEAMKSKDPTWYLWMSASPEEKYQLVEKLGLKVVLKGSDKIPKKGGVVVISNHITPGDEGILTHIFNQGRGDQLATCLLALPPQPGPLDAVYPTSLYLTKSTGTKHIQKMLPGGFEKIAKVLKDGRVFIVFPSGSIAFQEFKSGALRIALDNQVPILPVKIDFKLDWWLKFLFSIDPELAFGILIIRFIALCRQGKTMTITIGDLIPYSELEKYKESMVKTKNGERFSAWIMKELKKKVESIV